MNHALVLTLLAIDPPPTTLASVPDIAVHSPPPSEPSSAAATLGEPGHRPRTAWHADAGTERQPEERTYEQEPCSLAELRAAAVAVAMAEPSRAQSLVQRARWSGLLPEIRVGVVRRAATRASLDTASVDPVVSPIELWTTQDLRYEGRATWDLSRLVFNPDELNAQAQALRMGDVRREVELLVTRLYFERRRLQREAAHGGGNGQALANRIEELSEELDALSGGLLSRARSHRRSFSESP